MVEVSTAARREGKGGRVARWQVGTSKREGVEAFVPLCAQKYCLAMALVCVCESDEGGRAPASSLAVPGRSARAVVVADKD